MRTYRSIDEINHINVFLKILDSQDVRLMDKDYVEGKEYSPAQTDSLTAAWYALYDEYFRRKDDPNARRALKDSENLLVLAHKIQLMAREREGLIYLHTISQDPVVLEEIDADTFVEWEQAVYRRLADSGFGVKPLFFEGLLANIRNLEKVIKAMTNTYNLKKKDRDRVVTKERENVYVVHARMEKAFGQQLPNSNEMTTGQYLGYEKVIKEIENAKKQQNGKGEPGKR